MSRTTRNTVISCAALCLLLVGCGGMEAAPLAQQVSNQAALIAKVELDDGTVVEFFEPTPGELIIATGADSKEKLVTVEAVREHDSASQLYTSLSGREPPAALVEADRRVAAAQLQRPALDWYRQQGGTVIEQPAPAPQDGIGVKASALDVNLEAGHANGLTPQQFQTYCCVTLKNYWFKHCWPNSSGITGLKWISPSMHSIVYAAGGDVTQEMVVDGAVMSFTVPRSYWQHVYSVGATTVREVRASSASFQVWGATYYASYHHSIFGGWTTCGDANGDGVVTTADADYIGRFLKGKEPAPAPYWAGDANGDGWVTTADKYYILDFLLHGGPAPVC